MPLETATHISDFVTTNPDGTVDTVASLDNHIRMMKTVFKTDFPGISGPVTATHTELNYVDGVTSAIQTQLDAKAPKASPTFTGTVILPATGSGATEAVRKDYADGLAFAAALPAQTGNSGKFVTTDGSTASWATITPGGMVLLAVATPTAVATCDFTTAIDSTYEEYVFELTNVLPVTDDVGLYLRTSANGGSSFAAAGTDYISATAAAAQIAIAAAGISNVAAEGGLCASLHLHNPAGTASAKVVTGFGSWASTVATTQQEFTVKGRRDAVAAVNAVRFLFSAGNIASGTIKMYGLRKTV